MNHRHPLRTLAAALTIGVGGALAIPAATASPARASSCNGVAYSPPFSTTYGDPGRCSCSTAGSPGWRQGYSFTVQGNAGGPIAIQVLGYDDRGAEQWYGVGAYSPGDSGGASVPWGNVLSTPALRAAGTYGSPGAEVTFSC